MHFKAHNWIGQIYFVLGCIASVLLLIQFILLLIGFAGDGDIDIGGDGGKNATPL